jgi:hypothetical protein
MATTYLRAVHRSNSGSISAALKNTINYAENPDKTNGGVLVFGYECAPQLAANEFLLSKSRYEEITGRDQGKNDVIGYMMRQSFAPGEITPQEALEIGRDTAMRFTKGRHQFIVAVHTNTNCVHSHIFFNSVTLDCSRKFKDFKHSALALRKVSDHICAEHGLSIIENPGLSKGRDYAEYMQGRKAPTARAKLQDLIDANLIVGQSFGDFLVKLKRAGCEIKTGKHTAVKISDGKKNIRFDSLNEGYTEADLRARLMGTLDFTPRKISDASAERQAATRNDADAERKAAEYAAATHASEAPSLMIDIQAKIRQGYGPGYEQWAKIFNLREAGKTLIFLQNNGIDTYDDLKARASSVSGEYHRLIQKIREVETKQKDISDLQKQIGTYNKTYPTLQKYNAIKKPEAKQAFYESNRAGIELCRAAKRYFDAHGCKGKLLPIATLKQEWATLESEKKLLYKDYHAITPRHKELQTALMNASNLLRGNTLQVQERQAPRKSHDRDGR